MKPKQSRMFETQDLPLFSGTSQRAEEPIAATPDRVYIQQTIPARCAACLDTGWLDQGFCWCRAGDEAREAAPF